MVALLALGPNVHGLQFMDRDSGLVPRLAQKHLSPPSAFPETFGQIEDEVAQVQVDVVQEEENLEVKRQEAKMLNVKATWTSTTL